MAEPKRNEIIVEQIGLTWKSAQQQLAQLREQVEFVAELAQAKSQADHLVRDEERAWRDLGKAVWAKVARGELSLPASLSASVKAVEAVLRRREAQKADIGELLREGAEAATRKQRTKMKETKASGHMPVASKTKKR